MSESNPPTESAPQLPSWLRPYLEVGPVTDSYANKRFEQRRECSVYCVAHSIDEESGVPFHARIFNVDSRGFALLARREVVVSHRLQVRPDVEEEVAPVRVRVMHCTQTVQGYKVGCLLDPE